MKKHILNNLRLALIVIAILCLVNVIIHWLSTGSLTWEDMKWHFFYNAYYGIPVFLVNAIPHDLRRKYTHDQEPHQIKRNVVFMFFLGIVLTMLTLVILNLILWVGFFGHDIEIVFSRKKTGFYVTALVITTIVSLFFHAFYFYKEISKEKEISEQLSQEKLRSEHQALKAHIDPHFLFNSFNVLSGLIDEDAEKAQDFLAQLSRVYRYVLEQRENDVNTVQEELAFAKTYMQLYETRFEDSIRLEIDVEQGMQQQKIVSLSLQLLLENAVKHNALSVKNPLVIRIYNEGNTLVVTNNKTPKKILPQSSNMGLKNIQSRYELLGQYQVEIHNKNNSFTVKIPLIT